MSKSSNFPKDKVLSAKNFCFQNVSYFRKCPSLKIIVSPFIKRNDVSEAVLSFYARGCKNYNLKKNKISLIIVILFIFTLSCANFVFIYQLFINVLSNVEFK